MVNNVLDMNEACALLRLNRKTLAKLISKGEIPAVKAGRKYRFLKSELEKYISGRSSVRETAAAYSVRPGAKTGFLRSLSAGIYDGNVPADDHDSIYREGP